MRNGARTRGQRFRNRSKLPAVGGRGGAACDRESSSLNAPTEPEPTISYEGGGWSHASLATTPNRTVWTAGLQKLFHLAEDTSTVRPRPPGWEPNRGAGESILIQARGSKAYKGVDAYLVTRGANGYEFAPVGKEAVRKGRSAGLAA